MGVRMIILLFVSVILSIKFGNGIVVNFNGDVKITDISENLFKNYENSLITFVTITRTNASKIDKNTFTGMIELLSLDLQQNEIKELDEDTFKDNNKLENLELTKNRIEAIPSKLFSSVTALKKLDLSKNKINYLPQDVFSSLKQLEYLRIAHNKISEIHENQFSNLVNLKKLYLHANQILEIPSNIFQNNLQLEYFSIKYNNLKTVKSGTFTKLKHLTSLDLSYNEINKFEDNSLPKNLTNYFILNSNKLEYISPDILLIGKDAKNAIYCPNPLKCDSKIVDMFKVWKQYFAKRPNGQDCICKKPEKFEGFPLDDFTEEEFS